MGPCTFLVTAMVTNTSGKDKGAASIVKEAWQKNGIKGFYPGGTAIAFRQATNWASRQGFTDGKHSAERATLSLSWCACNACLAAAKFA